MIDISLSLMMNDYFSEVINDQEINKWPLIIIIITSFYILQNKLYHRVLSVLAFKVKIINAVYYSPELSECGS